MSNGHKLSGSGSNQSQPKKFPPGSISSDSSSAVPLLTEENVKKLEKEYMNSKEAFNKQKIEDYIKQSNLALSSKEITRKTSRELIWDEEPEGASSSFPTKWSEDPKEVHWKISEEISRKDKLLTELATDSLSALPIGSKLEESKQHVDGSSASPCSSRHHVEDVTTQTEWSYSVIAEEKKSSEGAKRSSLKPTKHQVVLFDSEKYSEREESKERTETEKEAATEGGEEKNQTGLCEQALYEPVDFAQRSPRPESEDEVPSRGHKHKCDWTLTALCMDEHNLTEESAKCKFCSGPEKPVPTVVDLKEQPHENFFCCRRYKEIFDTVIQELMSEDEIEKEIDIAPHPHRSQTELRCDIKTELLRQLNEEGFENYREIFQQYLRFAAWGKISFRLSEENEYTVRPLTAPSKKHRRTSAPPEDLLELDHDFVAEHLKHCHSLEPVTRYYPDGQTFLLLLPDGTGQVYYPSGNMAVLITYTKGTQFTYFILEDNRFTGIRAFFANRGCAACCHPNGHIWYSTRLGLPAPKSITLILWGAPQQASHASMQTPCQTHAPAPLEGAQLPRVASRGGAGVGRPPHWLCLRQALAQGTAFVPRVTLDLCAGICFHQEGTSQKRWNWWDFSPHIHSPPFQSIFVKLNSHITIKIVAQDQIYLTFINHSDHIHFNVGARLKLKDTETRHLLKRPESEAELFLQSKKIQLKSLLLKIQTKLHRFWHSLPQ
ncbi:glutamate-rich protein 6B [Dromaius novaehollandiae]|uniref:glutamate-rich protein 6B n=1 Tax=Dromaius novaehollandiae TaxID=8790 RepID=UPI00311D67E7